jgi:hypothetical protein
MIKVKINGKEHEFSWGDCFFKGIKIRGLGLDLPRGNIFLLRDGRKFLLPDHGFAYFQYGDEIIVEGPDEPV